MLIQNKKALVLGGTSSIGLEIALMLKTCGVTVRVAGRHNPQKAGIDFLQYDFEDFRTSGLGKLKEYIEECDKLEKLEEKKNYYEQEIKRSYEDVISIVEMKRLHESIEITKRAMEEQKIVIKKAEKKVEEEREKLNEAIKERKTFEKMKEKAFENFLEELKKEEDKVNDELVSFRFVNNDEQ